MKNASQVKQHLLFHLNSSNLKKVPALVGLTGVGKTAILTDVAKELGAELLYFNMAQLSEGELALPVPINERIEGNEGALVRYAFNHKLQDALNNPQKRFIVFADEFTRGTVPVISEWMTIINERQIQGQKFGPNVRFVAAMNPTSSMRDFHDSDYTATEMDDAHANRFTFIHMDADVNDWLTWAENEGQIHPLVTQFLRSTKNRQYFYQKEKDGIRMRTPRTWEFLSSSIKDADEQDVLKDQGFFYELVSDQIGADIAGTFVDFANDLMQSIEFEDIFNNKPLDKKTLNAFKLYDVVKQTILIDGFINQLQDDKDLASKALNPQALENLAAVVLAMKNIDSRYKATSIINQALFLTPNQDPNTVEANWAEIMIPDTDDNINNPAYKNRYAYRQFLVDQQSKIGIFEEKEEDKD